MTIKIEGFREEKRERAYCDNCTADLSYTKQDTISDERWTDEGSRVKWIPCPNCGNRIRLSW